MAIDVPKSGVQPIQERTHPDYLPDSILVKVASDPVRKLAPLPPPGSASLRAIESRHPAADWLSRFGGVLEVVPIHAEPPPGRMRPLGSLSPLHAFAASIDVHGPKPDELQGLNLVRLKPGANPDVAVQALSANPAVEYAQRVPARWILAPAPSLNDPMLNRQWALRAINYFDSAVVRDASTVNVCVLDTGVDTGHPDLPRVDYQPGGASNEDVIGHGTHVTGIISALCNNAIGIAGVAECRPKLWKIFSDTPASNGRYYVDEVMYQRALRAVSLLLPPVVMNLSIGGTATTNAELVLFDQLRQTGVLVVAAMGNEFGEGNPTEYPAAHREVIAVGATDEVDRRAPFSNTGDHIAICAPGVNILSVLPRSPSVTRDETEYASWSGTSMAAPHVTAAVAMLLQQNPAWRHQQVLNRLITTARPLGGNATGVHTPDFGFGLLQLA